MRLKNKVVLVTGASKGIGRALALGMAREGADLIVNYHSDRNAATEVARQVSSLGQKAILAQGDISSLAQIERMFQKIRRDFGRLDVLINNAGVTGWTSLFEVTEEKWDAVMDT